MGLTRTSNLIDTNPTATLSKQVLGQYIEENAHDLQGFITILLNRAGLQDIDIDSLKLEILGETIKTALEKIEDFDTTHPLKPWLLGIAKNKVLQCRSQINRREKREPLITDFEPADQVETLASELYDQLAHLNQWVFDELAQEGPEDQWIAQETKQEEVTQLRAALAQLSSTDREVIRLRFKGGLDGEELAQTLGIKHGAARVRLTRAMQRLTAIYHQREAK